MGADRRCPCCGYQWDAADVPGRADVSVDLVESMSREIRFLRETVATLRASGAVHPSKGGIRTRSPRAGR